MKNKKIYLLFILCFSLTFLMTSFDWVYAAEENGSLNIILTYGQEAIDGAEFSLYQAAGWNEEESRHTVKAPFQWDGDFMNIKTADDQLKLSLYFEKQSRNIKEAMKMETGEDGAAKFKGLEDGIYLAVQTGASGKAEQYTKVQPFLVIIPQIEHGLFNRSVTANPKPEPQTKEQPAISPQTPPGISSEKHPKTGDAANMFRWNGMLLISGGVMLLSFGRKKKRKDRGEERE